MMNPLKTRYTDRHGSVDTVIHNDGVLLVMEIGGVRFEGNDFDSLEAVAGNKEQLSRFTFANMGDLCDCTLEFEIAILIATPGGDEAETLFAELELGKPRANGSIDKEDLKLRLRYSEGAFESQGDRGWFEDALADIKNQLPVGHALKCCFGCAYSDYSPVGHGLFGNMLCFRNRKADYLEVRSKDDLLAIHDCFERQVQETYLCDDFDIREPGTGYRG